MRDATPSEFAKLAAGHCPMCDGFVFQPGPRGGGAQNIECLDCGTRYNVTIAGASRLALVFAQVIGSRPAADDWAAYRAKWGPLQLPGLTS